MCYLLSYWTYSFYKEDNFCKECKGVYQFHVRFKMVAMMRSLKCRSARNFYSQNNYRNGISKTHNLLYPNDKKQYIMYCYLSHTTADEVTRTALALRADKTGATLLRLSHCCVCSPARRAALLSLIITYNSQLIITPSLPAIVRLPASSDCGL